jgi:L-seryl-tRNA(Ser) seleniumtransferase
MQHVSVERLAERAARIVAGLGARAEVVPSIARVGGGAAPTRELDSRAVRIEAAVPDDLARALRAGDPPVVARVEDGALYLDLRTVDEADDQALALAVAAATRNQA